jgi:hypothetical protein
MIEWEDDNKTVSPIAAAVKLSLLCLRCMQFELGINYFRLSYLIPVVG